MNNLKVNNSKRRRVTMICCRNCNRFVKAVSWNQHYCSNPECQQARRVAYRKEISRQKKISKFRKELEKYDIKSMVDPDNIHISEFEELLRIIKDGKRTRRFYELVKSLKTYHSEVDKCGDALYYLREESPKTVFDIVSPLSIPYFWNVWQELENAIELERSIIILLFRVTDTISKMKKEKEQDNRFLSMIPHI